MDTTIDDNTSTCTNLRYVREFKRGTISFIPAGCNVTKYAPHQNLIKGDSGNFCITGKTKGR